MKVIVTGFEINAIDDLTGKKAKEVVVMRLADGVEKRVATKGFIPQLRMFASLPDLPEQPSLIRSQRGESVGRSEGDGTGRSRSESRTENVTRAKGKKDGDAA